jgi:chromosome segregation ATPase
MRASPTGSPIRCPITKSPFVEQLRQRELNLTRQLRELRETQANLENDKQQLAEERDQLTRREQELLSTEEELARQEQQISTIPALARAIGDLSRNQDLFERSAAALREQLSAAQSELASIRSQEEAKQAESSKLKSASADLRSQTAELEREEQALRSKSDLLSAYRASVQAAKRKAVQIERMGQSIESLRAEVRDREQRILDLEQLAIRRQDRIRTGEARRAALMQRHATAEERKKKMIASLAAKSERRRQYLVEREAVRNRQEAAEREQVELDQVEDTLARQEAISVPVGTLNPSDGAATTRIIERGKVTAEEFLLKYEEESVGVERRFERLEGIAAQRRNAIELEQAKWAALWKVKHKTADRRIEELRKELQEAENPSVLDDRWQTLTGETEALEEQLGAQAAEIKNLTEKSEAERAQIEQEEQELKEEKEKMRNELRALAQKLIEQKVAMDTLRHQEELVKLRTRDVAKRRIVAQTRLDIAARVLEVGQRQLVEAERQRQTLKQAGAPS